MKIEIIQNNGIKIAIVGEITPLYKQTPPRFHV